MRKVQVKCPFCSINHNIEYSDYGVFKAIYCDPKFHHDSMKCENTIAGGSLGCGKSFVVKIEINPIVSIFTISDTPIM